MLTPKEVAVLLDGEGYVGSELCYTGSCPYPCPGVYVNMTGENSYPRWMHEQFGGLFYHLKARSPKHKDTWKWKVNSRNCEEVLTYAFPEMRIKKIQAEAVLLMTTTIVSRGKRPTDKQMVLRWALHDALKKLNKRGPSIEQQVEEVIETLEEAES